MPPSRGSAKRTAPSHEVVEHGSDIRSAGLQAQAAAVAGPSSSKRSKVASPPPPDYNDEQPPPPPPSSRDADQGHPPPPPPPPADIEPPPPPPAGETLDEASRRAILHEQEQDDARIGGADYWSKVASGDVSSTANGGGTKSEQQIYLDTVNRSTLDFDFEKVCSVSLANVNVYACLVCGKYFQGRGTKSFAYLHSINDGHRVFIHLQTAEVYILPDNYRVQDPSLNDIKHLLSPTYSELHIQQLDAPDARTSRDLRGNVYLPGFVGLNNLGANDYMSVVLQALAHVKPLRNFFLRGGPPPAKGDDLQGKDMTDSPILSSSSELVRRFALLIRKMWNPRNSKAQVSPHEFLQEVANASKGRFSITRQGDPIEFMGWLLNRLHVDLGGGGKRQRRSIVSDCFMGDVRVESQKVFVRSGIELDDLDDNALDKLDSDGRKEGGQEDALGNAKFNIDREVSVTKSTFFLLTVDLPPLPVFQDVIERNIIPQVPLANVLEKYDGVTFQEARGLIRRFKTLKLPPFVVLHFKRFTKNNFIEERNRTIVNFPVKGFSMADYVDDPSMAPMSTTYDLLANITLDATAGTVRENCTWKSQVHTSIDGKPIGTHEERKRRLREHRRAARREERRRAGHEDSDDNDDDDDESPPNEEEKWFSIQDLIVESIDSQLLFLGESYVQIWARRAR